jgi:hypothetical protein
MDLPPQGVSGTPAPRWWRAIVGPLRQHAQWQEQHAEQEQEQEQEQKQKQKHKMDLQPSPVQPANMHPAVLQVCPLWIALDATNEHEWKEHECTEYEYEDGPMSSDEVSSAGPDSGHLSPWRSPPRTKNEVREPESHTTTPHPPNEDAEGGQKRRKKMRRVAFGDTTATSCAEARRRRSGGQSAAHPLVPFDLCFQGTTPWRTDTSANSAKSAAARQFSEAYSHTPLRQSTELAPPAAK